MGTNDSFDSLKRAGSFVQVFCPIMLVSKGVVSRILNLFTYFHTSRHVYLKTCIFFKSHKNSNSFKLFYSLD